MSSANGHGKLLEIIVTSPDEAREAERGGADRLELVRDLHLGGLTPDRDTVEQVLAAVRIPVRIMLRETPTMTLESAADLNEMTSFAKLFAKASVDGWVLGFLRDAQLDERSLESVLGVVPDRPVTFHRAFDEIRQPLAALERLKKFRQIDRILTVGGQGEWPVRRARLLAWSAAAQPEFKILFGAGLSSDSLDWLRAQPDIHEVHVGRAARVPATVSGVISQQAIRRLKSALA